MSSSMFSGLLCSTILIIFAVALLIYTLRRLSHPTRHTAVLSPPLASVPISSSVPAPSYLSSTSAPIASTPTLAVNLPYERIPTLLTPAEHDFFAVLQQAAPAGYHIFAQVRLANLVQVKARARRDKSNWWRIQAKCVDFVLADTATFAPCLVVELDDRSHDRADRQARDAFVDTVLAGVSIPILHVRWQRRYETATLAQQLASKLRTVSPPVPTVLSAAVAPAERFSAPIASAATRASAPAIAVPPQLTPVRRACGQCQGTLGAHAKFCTQCGTVCSSV